MCKQDFNCANIASHPLHPIPYLLSCPSHSLFFSFPVSSCFSVFFHLRLFIIFIFLPHLIAFTPVLCPLNLYCLSLPRTCFGFLFYLFLLFLLSTAKFLTFYFPIIPCMVFFSTHIHHLLQFHLALHCLLFLSFRFLLIFTSFFFLNLHILHPPPNAPSHKHLRSVSIELRR